MLGAKLGYRDIARFLLSTIVLTALLMVLKTELGAMEVFAISTMIVILIATINTVCNVAIMSTDVENFTVPDCERPDMSWATRMCRVNGEPIKEPFQLEDSNFSAPYAANIPFMSYGPHTERTPYDSTPFTNDFQYVTQPKEFYEPLGKEDETMNFGFHHGYSYLHTDKWTVPQRHPPVCISNVHQNVCPVAVGPRPMSVKEFLDGERIRPYDSINVDYIHNKLNARQ